MVRRYHHEGKKLKRKHSIKRTGAIAGLVIAGLMISFQLHAFFDLPSLGRSFLSIFNPFDKLTIAGTYRGTAEMVIKASASLARSVGYAGDALGITKIDSNEYLRKADQLEKSTGGIGAQIKDAKLLSKKASEDAEKTNGSSSNRVGKVKNGKTVPRLDSPA
uniref:Uncharacterized protein n=1 Tax=Candidatus Kentrum sp. LFY TaxID=2126342 RepID=A0A450UBB8_9GAMM|nr:MAG: hypothetical protein BECKLFY1418B_GA0070995_10161 [Candidatus Kentron sp. LFY]